MRTLFALFMILFVGQTLGMPMLKVAEDDFTLRAKKNIDSWLSSGKYWDVPDFGFPYLKAPVKHEIVWGNPAEFWNVQDLGLPYFENKA